MIIVFFFKSQLKDIINLKLTSMSTYSLNHKKFQETVHVHTI